MNNKLFSWLAVACYFVLLTLPDFVPLVGDTSPMGRLEATERMAYGVCAWLLWFAVFSSRLWLGVALSIALFLVWWPAELYLRLQVGTSVTSAFIGLLAETNQREVLDFASVYWPWGVLGLLPVAFGVLTACLAKQHALAWTHRSRIWVLILLPAFGFMTYMLFDQQQQNMDQGLSNRRDAFWVEPMGYWTGKWGAIYPLDPYFAITRYVQDLKRVQKLRQSVQDFKFGALRQATPAADIVVLVIGESSRADRWQLGGYARPTNPMLSRESNLVYLSDVVTYSVATRTAVPSIVSRSPIVGPLGTPNKVVEPSFLKALSEVGYRTHWLSNQSASGFFDTSVVFYARDADTVEFLNPANYGTEGAYDESLLGGLRHAVGSGGRTAVVLHTLGSHFNYAHRYPAAFDYFKPSIKQKEFAFNPEVVRKVEVNNAYDNSIRYTDYFLAQVIDAVKSTGRSAVVMYVSDHGEDIYEPGCLSRGLVRTSVASFRVPAMVWYSDQFARQRPEVVQHMKDMAGQPLQTNFAYQAMLDFASVSLPTPGRPMPSFATGFMPSGPRMVSGVNSQPVDFDEAVKRDRCRISTEK